MFPAYLVENMMHIQYSLIIQLSKEAARLSYLIFETKISRRSWHTGPFSCIASTILRKSTSPQVWIVAQAAVDVNVRVTKKKLGLNHQLRTRFSLSIAQRSSRFCLACSSSFSSQAIKHVIQKKTSVLRCSRFILQIVPQRRAFWNSIELILFLGPPTTSRIGNRENRKGGPT